LKFFLVACNRPGTLPQRTGAEELILKSTELFPLNHGVDLT